MDGFDLGSIIAHIRADTTQFTAGLEQAKTQADGFASHLSGIAMGAAAVVDAIVIGFGVKAVKAFSEAQVITGQLNQVLQTTGKASTLTTGEVEKLAMSLENYSGQTHTAIEQGQTILLQFSGITQKTLPEASRAMVDIAQRMGIDTVSAAKTLGIALDNPDQGLARLKRSGIDFTDAQKEQIKTMQKSGDTAGAAALMMKILETKVGGAGGAYRNTLAGGVENAKNKLKDFEELLGGKIIKTLNEAYDWYSKHARILNDVAGVVGTLVGVLAGMLVLYGNWIMLTKAITLVQTLLNVVMDMNPIVLAIMAIVVVAALLLEHWQTVKQWFDDFMAWFKQHWDIILLVFAPFLLIPIEIIKHFSAIVDWFSGLPGMIKNAIGAVGNLLYDIGKSIIQGLINGVSDMAKNVEDKVKAVANGIKDVAKKILGVFSPSTVFHDIGMNVGQGLVNGMNAMSNAVQGAAGNMAISAVAPAAAIINNASSNSNSTVNTNISGPINIGSNADAQSFLTQLTKNQELAMKGITPVK